MEVILLSLFWMFWFGVFDYLIASPARKIKSLQLIFILTGINAIWLTIIFLFLWEWWYFGKEIIFPILAGYVGHLGVFFYTKSLATGKIWISSSVANAYPIVTVFFSYIFLKEYFSVWQWIFFMLVVLGIIFSSFHINEIRNFRIEKQKDSLFYALWAMLCWAGFVIFYDRSVEYFWAALSWIVAESIVFISLLTYFLFSKKLSKTYFNNVDLKNIWRIWLVTFFWVFWFLSVWYAFSLWSLAIVSAIAACSPVVTTLFARIFWNEKLEFIQYIAIWVLVFGIAGLSYFSV